MKPRLLVGLDLGKAQDYTALAVLSRPRFTGNEPKPHVAPAYDVPHLQRFPLGTPYPEIVERVMTLLRSPPLRGCMLVVDQTEVGGPVVDMLTDATEGQVTCSFCGITITSGHSMTTDSNGQFRVPKKELIASVQVLLQTRRMRILRTLPEAAVLVRELENYRVKITEAANETFGAWREGQHDDLVLAVTLAAWMGEWMLEYEGKPVGIPRVIGGY